MEIKRESGDPVPSLLVCVWGGAPVKSTVWHEDRERERGEKEEEGCVK